MPAEPSTPARRLAEAIAAAAADLKAGGSIGVHADSLRRLVAEFGTAAGGNGPRELLEALGPALRARGVSMPSLDRLPPSVAAYFEAVDDALDGASAGDAPPDLESIAARLERAAAAAYGGPTVTEARAQALREQIRREVSASIAATVRAHGLTPAADMVEDGADDDLDEGPRVR
ncbi:hypothetical protein [Sorangium sp. So ce385]|uniref:hypothetical protein n=1 Tax=Sorangium sp. So ce385 TaxID=3133308 RepID=UPI003F5B72B6